MNYYLDKHSEAIDRNNRKYNEVSTLPDPKGFIPGDSIIIKDGNKYKLNRNKEWELFN